jgi:hypothetical protein
VATRNAARSVAWLLACGLALVACKDRVATAVSGHVIPPRALSNVALGKTTAAELTTLFGEPDERAPDGSMTYRSRTVRTTVPALVHWSSQDDEQVDEETVTFRFENGAVAKICRTRS